jgi:hypothetical protein
MKTLLMPVIITKITVVYDTNEYIHKAVSITFLYKFCEHLSLLFNVVK